MNGIGCEAEYPTNLTALDPLRPMRPQQVNNCLVEYIYVETIHAGIQCAFAVRIVVVGVVYVLLVIIVEVKSNC